METRSREEERRSDGWEREELRGAERIGHGDFEMVMLPEMKRSMRKR